MTTSTDRAKVQKPSDADVSEVLGRIQQMRRNFDEGRRKVSLGKARLKKL